MKSGHQKVDHGGNFFMTPRKVVDSAAWREMTGRACKILMLFQARFNGDNNGKIVFSIHGISAALGNQNHGATSKAVAELIERGFLECMSDADRHHSKAREYRLTFASSGGKKGGHSATHEYLEWRAPPGDRRKFGGARTAPLHGNIPSETTMARKFSGVDFASHIAETAQISVGGDLADSALHLGNHPVVIGGDSGNSPLPPRPQPGCPAGVPTDDLRQWMAAVLARQGHGGQKLLSDQSGVPQPVLCKFKNGRGLPAHYHIKLQTACGRLLPFKEWRATAGL